MVLFHPKTKKERLIIGITQTAHGLGVTHLCIALANFMASKQKKKTACLELSTSDAFSQLYSMPKDASMPSYFQIHDVDYYPNVQKTDIPMLINSGYEILILDFGILTDTCLDELLRCDRKLLLCSNAPWRKAELSSCLSSYPQLRKMEFLLFMIKYGNHIGIAKFAWEFSIPYGQFRIVPFLQNPFHIEKEWFTFFDSLLLP